MWIFSPCLEWRRARRAAKQATFSNTCLERARLYNTIAEDLQHLLTQCRKNARERRAHDTTFEQFLLVVMHDVALQYGVDVDWIEVYATVFSFCAVHTAHAMSFAFAEYLLRKELLTRGELKRIVTRHPYLFHTLSVVSFV